MRVVFALISISLMHGISVAQTSSIFPGKTDTTLILDLRNSYYPTSPKDYDDARDSMYSSIDVDLSDSLTCVYSGLRAKADGSRTPSNGGLSFNTEHTWPQSFYDNAEPMRGDIHHLFPTWSSPNQSRSNHPFGEIDDNLTSSWWYWANGGSINSIPSSNIDAYSEYYDSTFEPREDHKGNVARAIFYFWTMYETNTDIINDTQDNDAFFNGMKNTLYSWHNLDPVDSEEVARSLKIEAVQGNRNPFIHDTTLVRRAFFSDSETSSSEMPDVYISEVYEANGGVVKYIELFNTTENDIQLENENYRLHRFSNASLSGVEIPITGNIPAKGFFVIGNDDAMNGVQSIFGDGIVNQDNSQINHNGNDKYLLLRAVSDTLDSFALDNIGNSGDFSSNQVAYRVAGSLPNNGSFGQSDAVSNGDTTASGNWVMFNISSANGNAKLVGTPGFNAGIESELNPEALITGDAGWRLISIPGKNASLDQISNDNLIQGVGSSANPNIFLYNSTGSYSTPNTINEVIPEGNGLLMYFFNNDENGSISLPATLDNELEKQDGDITVDLNTGTLIGNSYFTLIGNPFQTNLDASEIIFNGQSQANIHVLNDGLYETVDLSSTIVRPWQAFWVETPAANPASQLTIPLSSKTENTATLHAFSKVMQENQNQINLSLESSATFDKGCTILFNDDAVHSWDRYDAQKLQPTRDTYSILACTNEQTQQSKLSLPQTISNGLEIPISVQAVNTDSEHYVHWSVSNSLLNQYSIHLVDLTTNHRLELNQSGHYSFEVESKKSKSGLSDLGLQPKLQDSEHRFVLRFSEWEEPIEEPTSFTIKQNYPNPFNPQTTLEYSIPEEGKVSIEIFNIQGIKVESSVDNQLKNRGSFTVSWNAENYASGVYLAKISFEETSQFVKMLLIK